MASKIVSRQRRWQIKQNEQGKCQLCPKDIVFSRYCFKHGIANRENSRELKGYTRRNLNAASYKLEKLYREEV